MRYLRDPSIAVFIAATSSLLLACNANAEPPTPLSPAATATLESPQPASETPSPVPLTSTPELSPTSDEPPPIGTAVLVELPEGDAVRGEALAIEKCIACHDSGQGPSLGSSEDQVAIAERADLRIAQEDYAGRALTGEQYLIESVTSPWVFKEEGWELINMPGFYGFSLSLQDMADLIAWMRTLD